MIDSFLSISDAESLPSYRMELKLACVTLCVLFIGLSNVSVLSVPNFRVDGFHREDGLHQCHHVAHETFWEHAGIGCMIGIPMKGITRIVLMLGRTTSCPK